jgi:serine/threonine protein phosphatase 1
LRFSAAPHKGVARVGPVFAPAMWCLRTTRSEALGKDSGVGRPNCYGRGVIQVLRKLLSRQPAGEWLPAVPHGERVYAVGDVHGRLDLFEALHDAIEHEIAGAPRLTPTVILLGDLVDRGPGSAAVIAAARAWSERRQLHILFGNHEEMFLRSLTDEDVLRQFLRHGGRQTLLSYGVSREAYASATLPEIQQLARKAVPIEDLEFIARFEDMVAVGDYLFVHAGIAPGVPIEEQKTADLRWIREPFLSHEEDHGRVIVHGHTIAPRPVVRGNRIGIDTGAYDSGRLTALVLEGTGRRFLEALDTDGAITVSSREAE